METLIFCIYLITFLFVVTRIPFFLRSHLKKWQIAGLFLVKIGAGLAYAKYYQLPKNFANSDTWRYYHESLKETAWLKNAPFEFVISLFHHGYSSPGNLFKGQNSYWNDLKSNVIIKMLAIANLFTWSSYYTNIVLFNFLFLPGLIALYRLFKNLFPGTPNVAVISGVFLLPSTLFWCSGIHKDGLLLSALGLFSYSLYKCLYHKITFAHIIIILVSLLLIFSLRNFVTAAILPAAFAWIITKKTKQSPVVVFTLTYVLFLAVFFFSPGSFPSYIANKQKEFLQLHGNSQITVPELKPTLPGFIQNLPSALDIAFLRPHLSEVKSLAYLPALIEVWLIAVLLILASFKAVRQGFHIIRPGVLFLLFLSITILLICGLTVPFTGAIVRYRSLVLPLLLTPLLCWLWKPTFLRPEKTSSIKL